MKSWIPFLAGFVLTSNFAAAQSILFQDGFENGFQNWAASGLWNHELATDPCGSEATPFPEGIGAAWYGIPASCNFEAPGGTNFGSLELLPWIPIPSGVAAVNLYFQSWVDSEYCWNGWDIHAVDIEVSGGTANGVHVELCSWAGPVPVFLRWHERRIDLSAYRGAQIRLRFTFSSGDGADNGGLGWLVDNVRIIAEPGRTMCPSEYPSNYCPCNPLLPVGGGCFNSRWKSATLVSSGVASVAQDTLAFQAAEMPLGTAGTLFQANGGIYLTLFGDGMLCVTGSLMRLGTQFAPTGAVDWPAPGLGTLSSAGFVPPAGGVFQYQVIYRDAVPTFCTGATFNLTSAQQVSWTP